jgi:hypothetical protein
MQHPEWKEQPGWQQVWAQHQYESEDLLERQKRYGRVRQQFEEDDFLVIRFFLPKLVPPHPWLYRFGLPRVLTPYKIEATLSTPTDVEIRGYMQDPSIQPLCGLINSFPDRFVHVIPLSKKGNQVEVIDIDPYIKDVKVTYLR